MSKEWWPAFIVTYYVNWVTTSWTFSTQWACMFFTHSSRGVSFLFCPKTQQNNSAQKNFENMKKKILFLVSSFNFYCIYLPTVLSSSLKKNVFCAKFSFFYFCPIFLFVYLFVCLSYFWSVWMSLSYPIFVNNFASMDSMSFLGGAIRFGICIYCMVKKSWPILYSSLQYRINQDFLTIQYVSRSIDQFLGHLTILPAFRITLATTSH